MAFDQKELENQLFEAGNKLADPPSSVDELLSLLNQLESYLSKVEQAPKYSMRTALAPSLKELVGDKLLRHPDPDVKVALAACISEITRISAPDAPYNDDQMKEIFQLVVSSFENLHDTSSRSYDRRRVILETVAKVRSCVVMLDLECDALILEMFQHFLKAIRDDHPKDVFSAMETIMTLVLEESEDISFELISPLLDSIKKNNEEVFPIARKLGERVLENCAPKIKPCLVQAVRTLSISMEDYSEVLGSICQEEAKAIKEAPQLPKDNQNGNRSSKSVTNDVVARVGEDEELNDLDDGKFERKPEEATKKSRRKPSYSTKSAKPSEKMIDSESHRKEVLSSGHEDQERDDKVIKVALALPSPRAYNDESQVVASPSPSDSLPDENHSEKLGKAETEDSPANVEVAEAVSKKANLSSIKKTVKQPVRKVLGQNSSVKKTAGTDSSKKRSGSASGADAKKHSAKKLDDNEGGGGSSSSQLVDKKKWGREEMVSSPRSDTKSSEDEKLEETTKTNGKRKHASGRKNESDIMEYDQNLVGVRVEVWWPKDRQFYKGVIESFDFRKKKHKVVYDDGEVEVLNLAREKWNVIEADSDANEEEGSDRGSLDASTEMPARKKTKPSSGEPTKQGKLGLSSSGGASGSSKSKGLLKSGQKSMGGYKLNESKTVSDSEDEVSRKFKDSTSKSGSSKPATQKMTGKSKNIVGSRTSKQKDDENITPKSSVEAKQDTPKSGKTPKTAASEGKPPKSGEKSTADSGGKGKSNSLKKKHFEDDDSDSDSDSDSASEEVEDTKGKTSGSSKAQGSEAMKGKKRQRS